MLNMYSTLAPATCNSYWLKIFKNTFVAWNFQNGSPVGRSKDQAATHTYSIFQEKHLPFTVANVQRSWLSL